MKAGFTLGLVMMLTGSVAAAEQRVLLVVANGAPAGERKSGYDLGELAQAHEIFQKNGFTVDIATPAGGKAHTEKAEKNKPYVAAFLSNSSHVEQLERTTAIADVDASRYAAVFLVGGSAAMFDFPSHAGLQRQIEKIYQRGGVIGAVCHGPAALVDVKHRNGRYLVTGRRVSGFTDEEESAFSADAARAYPFSLEQRLKQRGATFEEAAMMMVHVSRDGRLVTGQNPFSTPRAVEEVIRALGRVPVRRRPYKDESTILLIGDLLLDESAAAARSALERSPTDYDPSLIAIYGSYILERAEDETTTRRAAMLLELGSRYFAHPKVQLALARAHVRLGDRGAARNILVAATAKYPQSEPITKALDELNGGSHP